MRKLLRANFSRLMKDKLFGILMAAELFLGGLFPIFHYMDNLDEKAGWTQDSTFFIMAIFVPMMISVVTSLFIGTEYSDGTMRNKLIVGHGRSRIYAANLITNIETAFMLMFAFMVTHICVGTPLLGWFEADAKKIIAYVLVSLMMTAACTSIFTLIAMLCSNKAYSVAGCILLIFLLLFMGIRITSALNEPEYYSAYSYTENGVTVAEDEERNPNYLSGTKREVFEFLNEFLPGGQMLKMSTMKVDHLGRSAVYDGIIFVVTTGSGLLIFRKKDLK